MKEQWDERYYIGTIPEEAVSDCTSQGSCDEAVEYWVNKTGFHIPEEQQSYAREDAGSTGAFVGEEERLDNLEYLTHFVFWQFCLTLSQDGMDCPLYLGV